MPKPSGTQILNYEHFKSLLKPLSGNCLIARRIANLDLSIPAQKRKAIRLTSSIFYQGTSYTFRRLAYLFYFNRLPPTDTKLYVKPTCHPLCCNPKHVYVKPIQRYQDTPESKEDLEQISKILAKE